MGDRRAWFVVVLAVLLSWSVPVAAQPDEVEMPEDEPIPDVSPEGDAPETPAEPTPEMKAAARKLLDGGDGFLKKGDYHTRRKRTEQATAEYERALAAYQKAYELVPNAKILFPIAIAEQKLGKLPEAATHFRQFLNEAEDVSDKMRSDAEKRLEEIKLEIGVLRLSITPEGAAVAIDGAQVGTSPMTLPVFLAPGEYTLAITADGYKPLEQKLTIEAGSESERSFELESAAVIIDAPVRPPPPPPPPPAPEAPSKMMLYITGGATIALIAGATTTGIMAVGKNSTYKDDPESSAGQSARESGKNLALLTDGLIVGAVVAGGLTAYYYTKIYKPKQRAYERKLEDRKSGVIGRRPPKVIVTPWVQADGGGLVLTAPL